MSSASTNQRGLLIVLCGPSGVGKSTISRRLSQLLDVAYTVSATTRPKAAGDDEKKKYDHITKQEFFRRLDNDQFLEYAQVYGEYYGTPKHPALDQLETGRDVLLEIDVQGALQVRYQHPESLTIFILPPDEPTLLRRLVDRARDSEEEMNKRFRAAKREIHMAKGARCFDYMVINDNLDSAVDEIVKIIRHKRANI
ncbi:MAG TPA: guanylate kinase [Tepidisphaeraceae bacterium]|jgi:guanylate kinase|nr:guanylate kinase [Tepidisphaeraceae bacterium]